jgi:hypothetical protein
MAHYTIKDADVQRSWNNLPYYMADRTKPFGHHLIIEKVLRVDPIVTTEQILLVPHAACFGWLKNNDGPQYNIKRLLLPIGYNFGKPRSENSLSARIELIRWLTSSNTSPYRKLFPYIFVHTGRLVPNIHENVPLAIEVMDTNVDNRSIINFLIAVRSVNVFHNQSAIWYDLVTKHHVEPVRAYWLSWHINRDHQGDIFAYGFSLGGDVPFDITNQGEPNNTSNKYLDHYVSLKKMIEGDIPVEPSESRKFMTNQRYVPCNDIWSRKTQARVPFKCHGTSRKLEDNIPIYLKSLEERLNEELGIKSEPMKAKELPPKVFNYQDLRASSVTSVRIGI